jgi:CheY-like chemotaxis protein
MPQIIIVGQNSAYMENMVALIESEEFSVICISYGEEAIDAVADDTKIIFVEPELPEYPAHEFAQHVRNDSTLAITPSIMLWDNAHHTKEELAAHGFDGVVSREPTLDWFREFIHSQIRD